MFRHTHVPAWVSISVFQTRMISLISWNLKRTVGVWDVRKILCRPIRARLLPRVSAMPDSPDRMVARVRSAVYTITKRDLGLVPASLVRQTSTRPQAALTLPHVCSALLARTSAPRII